MDGKLQALGLRVETVLGLRLPCENEVVVSSSQSASDHHLGNNINRVDYCITKHAVGVSVVPNEVLCEKWALRFT